MAGSTRPTRFRPRRKQLVIIATARFMETLGGFAPSEAEEPNPSIPRAYRDLNQALERWQVERLYDLARHPRQATTAVIKRFAQRTGLSPKSVHRTIADIRHGREPASWHWARREHKV